MGVKNVSGSIGLTILENYNYKNKFYIYYDEHESDKYCNEEFFVDDFIKKMLNKIEPKKYIRLYASIRMQIKTNQVMTIVITPPPSILAEYKPRTKPTIITMNDKATLILKIIISTSGICIISPGKESPE